MLTRDLIVRNILIYTMVNCIHLEYDLRRVEICSKVLIP